MVRPLPNTFWSSLRGNCIVSRHDGLTKNNIRDLPLSGKWQSDLIQLEHRTPGVGVENGITPCRLSACSMLSSVEATLVGGCCPCSPNIGPTEGDIPLRGQDRLA